MLHIHAYIPRRSKLRADGDDPNIRRSMLDRHAEGCQRFAGTLGDSLHSGHYLGAAPYGVLHGEAHG